MTRSHRAPKLAFSHLALALFTLFFAVALPSAAETAPSVDGVGDCAPVAAALPLATPPAWAVSGDVKAGPALAECDVSATCQDGTTVSCSAAGSSTGCIGVDSDCSADPWVVGYVDCGYGKIYCDLCTFDPPCDGTARCIWNAPCDQSGCCGTGSCVGGRCNCDA